jgi:hypothetical protein
MDVNIDIKSVSQHALTSQPKSSSLHCAFVCGVSCYLIAGCDSGGKCRH